MSGRGYGVSRIQAHLALENIAVSKKSLSLLIKTYRLTGSVADHRTIKPARKLKDEHYRFIDECMATDDELTATKLLAMLKEKYSSLNISISTVQRARVELGWAAKKTRYGAMISENNLNMHTCR
jgi:transposase